MLSRYFPILRWGRSYSGSFFAEDALAAVIVTIMLIPQSLAYAMIAGLPPQAGLYATIRDDFSLISIGGCAVLRVRAVCGML